MLACPVGSRSTHPSRSFITTHPGSRTIQDATSKRMECGVALCGSNEETRVNSSPAMTPHPPRHEQPMGLKAGQHVDYAKNNVVPRHRVTRVGGRDTS
jgi:hypothetical protein